MQDVLQVYAACAQASRWLRLTPFCGNRWVGMVHDSITAGWSSGEVSMHV